MFRRRTVSWPSRLVIPGHGGRLSAMVMMEVVVDEGERKKKAEVGSAIIIIIIIPRVPTVSQLTEIESIGHKLSEITWC